MKNKFDDMSVETGPTKPNVHCKRKFSHSSTATYTVVIPLMDTVVQAVESLKFFNLFSQRSFIKFL